MAFSGGSVGFSFIGGSYSNAQYSVTYNAPSYTPPSGYSIFDPMWISSAGPATVYCSQSASQTYSVTIRKNSAPYTITTESYTISGSSPTCQIAPTFPSASITITGSTSTSISYSWTSSYGTGTSPRYVIVNFPDGTSSSAQSGTYTATGLTTPGASYTATIVASAYFSSIGDSVSASDSKTLTKSSAPVFTDTTLAQAMANVAYSDAVAATNTTSYSASVISGSLNGLTFNSNGTLTGTPTAAGSATLSVTATNSGSMPTSTTTSVSLEIINASPMVYNSGTASWVRSQGVYVYQNGQWVIAQMQVRDSGNTSWGPPG